MAARPYESWSVPRRPAAAWSGAPGGSTLAPGTSRSGPPPIRAMRATLAVFAVLACTVACRTTTSRLPPDLASRFAAESVVRRADDQVFRYSYYSRSTRGNRWEDRDASIIVTRSSVFIHKNDKVGLDLTPSTRKATEVRREGDRVIISAGSGQSRVSWSFRPPADAEGWAGDIRAVLAGGP